jgi:hypothetical protein
VGYFFWHVPGRAGDDFVIHRKYIGDIMNPEIKAVVENMKRGEKESLGSTDILVYQLSQMAHLLSLLSEEAETQSKKISEQTDKLVTSTKYLLWFTGALFVVGFGQIGLMIFKP